MEERSSSLMKRYSRLCMSGCADNYKKFFLGESTNFVNSGGIVLNEMKTM
jgi:hypothetical protein